MFIEGDREVHVTDFYQHSSPIYDIQGDNSLLSEVKFGGKTCSGQYN